MDAGTYQFSGFAEREQELARLKHQAAVAHELETQILHACGLSEGMAVLDLACGPGVVSQQIAAIIGSNGRVLGVDLSAELLDEARKSAAQSSLSNLEFAEGNVYDLKLGADQFDFVYARFLFQHLNDPGRALDNIRRVLKPGGVVAIVDVDDAWLTLHPEPAAFAPFTRRAAETQQRNGGDRFVGRKLTGLLSAAGFTEARINVTTVTSQQIGLKSFLDITTGFKLEQMNAEDKPIAREERDQIYELLNDPSALGAVGIWVATGRK
jgi:ubiquinone/menaquinone biosynthesis C-methylase UbiE